MTFHGYVRWWLVKINKFAFRWSVIYYLKYRVKTRRKRFVKLPRQKIQCFIYRKCYVNYERTQMKSNQKMVIFRQNYQENCYHSDVRLVILWLCGQFATEVVNMLIPFFRANRIDYFFLFNVSFIVISWFIIQ